LHINKHPKQAFSTLFILLTSAYLAALSCANNTSAEYRHTIFAFGTLIEVTLLNTTEIKANTAFDHLERSFHDYHASWTSWEASDLSRINESIQACSRVSVPQQVLPLIIASKDLSEKSNGLFNPAIGNLINLWQMHRHDESDISPPPMQPTSAEC